ncbi:hypothetical protein [Hyalangium versicolor]|uniref:hypothetical protein n=1 Tax=Hyalangium versicolor TaxID=2861190 RepID=UPI001CCCB810|nr:hypothetical protein [Hyalangium versicolor]
MPTPKEDDNGAAWARWYQKQEQLREQCLAVASGKAPLETVPAPCLAALETHRNVMGRVLAATHAETGGLPSGANSLNRSDSLQSGGMGAIARVVHLAALEVWELLSRGHPVEAMNTCLDALALSRELALGGGLYGSKLSAQSQEIVYPSCAAALDAVPLGRKREALEQLSRLQRGFPPPSRLLREESVFLQLRTFGPDFLPLEALSRLPPAAKTLVHGGGGWFFFTSRVGHPLVRRYIWRRNVSLFDQMMAVADLPPDERQRAFARIDADHALLADYPGAVSARTFHRELAHLEPQHLRAVALATLVQVDITRTEQGRWPTTLPADATGLFSLQLVSAQEARLVPLNTEAAENTLSVTADER